MTQPVYRAASAADLVGPIALEDFVLLFHKPSGATHLLVEPAPQILEALRQGPADVTIIAARLALHFGLESEGEIEAVLAERLRELAGLGLVEVS